MRGPVTALTILTLALGACGGEAPPSGPPPREPIGIRYVVDSELPIRASRDPNAEVIATFVVGETVSVLADHGDWTEVRVNYAQSGWVPTSALTATPPPPGDVRQGGRPVPQFRNPPATVFSPTGAKGQIVLEANVNSSGDVASVRVLTNTTGRKDLEIQNVEALKQAKFYPLVRGGNRQPFIYEHRVTY